MVIALQGKLMDRQVLFIGKFKNWECANVIMLSLCLYTFPIQRLHSIKVASPL